MIKVSTQVLRTALDRVAKAVPNKALIPVTDAVMFIPEGDDMTIYTTDSNIFARTYVVCETEEPVPFGVDFHKLHSIISKFSTDEEVNLLINSKKVIVKGKGKRYSLPYYNPKEAIECPDINGDEIRVGIGDFLGACDSIKGLIDIRQDLRPALSAFNIISKSDRLTLFATDSFSMGKCFIESKGEPCVFLVSPRVISCMDPKEKGILSIFQDETRIMFRTVNLDVISVKPQHKMPPLIEKLFDGAEKERCIELDHAELQSAIARLSAFIGKDGYAIIKFDIKESLLLTSKDMMGDSIGEESINIVHNFGENNSFHLNGAHLLMILSNLKCGKLKIYIPEDTSPVRIMSDEVEDKEFLSARVIA